MRKSLMAMGLAGLVFLTACAAATPVDLAIRNVTVVDVQGGRLEPGRDVLVSGGRIVAIESTGSGNWAASEVIEGRGLYLAPGLVDMHVHLRHPGVLPLLLAHGVTTVRNMNGSFGHAREWAAGTSDGTVAGPRIVNASPTIREDQDSSYRAVIRSPDDARSLVARFVDEGWRWIKVYQVPPAYYDVLAAAADSVDLPITGHIPWYAEDSADRAEWRQGVLRAIAPMTTVEHMGGFLHGWFAGQPDASELAGLADAIAATGVEAVTPILGQDYRLAAIVAAGADGVGVEYREQVKRYTGAEGIGALDGTIVAMAGGEPRYPDFQRRMAVALHRAGVTVLLGTDAHGPFALAGQALADEAVLLQEGGIAPPDVLRAATVDAATVLGLEDRIGFVGVGLDADLVLLRADPLRDVSALSGVVAVVAGGRVHDEIWIEDRLDAAAAAPPYCRLPVCD